MNELTESEAKVDWHKLFCGATEDILTLGRKHHCFLALSCIGMKVGQISDHDELRKIAVALERLMSEIGASFE